MLCVCETCGHKSRHLGFWSSKKSLFMQWVHFLPLWWPMRLYKFTWVECFQMISEDDYGSFLQEWRQRWKEFHCSQHSLLILCECFAICLCSPLTRRSGQAPHLAVNWSVCVLTPPGTPDPAACWCNPGKQQAMIQVTGSLPPQGTATLTCQLPDSALVEYLAIVGI